MIEEYIIYLFYAFLLFWVIKKKIAFIYFVPFFSMGMDMSLTYLPSFSWPAYIRAIVFFLFYFYCRNYFKLTKSSLYFYLFFLWMLLLLFFSEEFLYSFKFVIQVVFSMAIFILAYNHFTTKEKLNLLLKNLFWILVIAIIATAVGYVFGIGKVFDYQGKSDTDVQIIGLLGSSGLYTPGIVLALTPLIIKTNLKKYQKILLPFLIVILYIFFLLTVRRTVILIPIVGIVGFFIYSKRKVRIIKYLIFAFLLLILISPLYESILIKRFEARQNLGRFEDDFYKTEMRYVENVDLIETLTKFEDPAKILFGFGNNIFAENIKDNKIVTRMYHTDITKLFYGVGLFGLFIYLLIYIMLFNKIRNIPNNNQFLLYKSAALGLFLISVFVSINGSITIVSFRSLNFLLLGAILGYVQNTRYKEQLLYIKGKEKQINENHGFYN
jgi:hypothetical protein